VTAGVGGDRSLGEGLGERVVAGAMVARTRVRARRSEVGGSGEVAFEHEPCEVRDVQLGLGQHAVGERLGGRCVPPAAAVLRSGGVPRRRVRDVEHLQAQDGPPLGRPGWVDGGWLVPRECRMLGQQPVLGLAHGGHELPRGEAVLTAVPPLSCEQQEVHGERPDRAGDEATSDWAERSHRPFSMWRRARADASSGVRPPSRALM
jgi:hypothetical protein